MLYKFIVIICLLPYILFIVRAREDDVFPIIFKESDSVPANKLTSDEIKALLYAAMQDLPCKKITIGNRLLPVIQVDLVPFFRNSGHGESYREKMDVIISRIVEYLVMLDDATENQGVCGEGKTTFPWMSTNCLEINVLGLFEVITSLQNTAAGQVSTDDLGTIDFWYFLKNLPIVTRNYSRPVLIPIMSSKDLWSNDAKGIQQSLQQADPRGKELVILLSLSDDMFGQSIKPNFRTLSLAALEEQTEAVISKVSRDKSVYSLESAVAFDFLDNARSKTTEERQKKGEKRGRRAFGRTMIVKDQMQLQEGYSGLYCICLLSNLKLYYIRLFVNLFIYLFTLKGSCFIEDPEVKPDGQPNKSSLLICLEDQSKSPAFLVSSIFDITKSQHVQKQFLLQFHLFRRQKLVQSQRKQIEHAKCKTVFSFNQQVQLHFQETQLLEARIQKQIDELDDGHQRQLTKKSSQSLTTSSSATISASCTALTQLVPGWTQQELESLVAVQKRLGKKWSLLGNDWAQISREFPRRSRDEVANAWIKVFNAKRDSDARNDDSEVVTSSSATSLPIFAKIGDPLCSSKTSRK